MKKNKPIFNKRRFKYNTYSVIITAIFVAIIILINIFASLILKRIGGSIDLSQGEMYSISDETINFLKGITDEVTITVMNRENDFVETSGGEYYRQVNEVLKRFTSINDKITLDYKDLLSNPDFAAEYDGVAAGSIVIKSKSTNRYRILDSNDYFLISYYNMMDGSQISESEAKAYYSYGLSEMIQSDISAKAEGSFISAILSVTNEEPVYVNTATGHGESENEQAISLLSENAYIIEKIDLVSSEIPVETDFLIIDSPEADYSDDSIERLSLWLDNGGKFGKTLMYIANEKSETPRLDAFLAEWGISIERAYIGQTNADHRASMPSSSGMTIQYFKPYEFSERLNPNYNIMATLLRSVNQLFEAKSNIETKILISSFDGAVEVPFDEMNDPEWKIDENSLGEKSAAVISRKTRFEELDSISSTVIAFGGGDLLSPEFLSMKNANNAEFLIEMMNSICGKDSVITITPKSFSVPTFQITAKQTNVIGFIFVVALPLVIILIGIIVWIRRRHR